MVVGPVIITGTWTVSLRGFMEEGTSKLSLKEA